MARRAEEQAAIAVQQDTAAAKLCSWTESIISHLFEKSAEKLPELPDLLRIPVPSAAGMQTGGAGKAVCRNVFSVAGKNTEKQLSLLLSPSLLFAVLLKYWILNEIVKRICMKNALMRIAAMKKVCLWRWLRVFSILILSHGFLFVKLQGNVYRNSAVCRESGRSCWIILFFLYKNLWNSVAADMSQPGCASGLTVIYVYSGAAPIRSR